ncbi:MAG: class I SAM-dependent methyltransferase [Polyangiales bacterium]
MARQTPWMLMACKHNRDDSGTAMGSAVDSSGLSDDASFETAWRYRFEEFAKSSEDDAGIAGWSQTGLEARVRMFLSAWKPPASGGRWLDAGCGAGTYSRILARSGLEVVGADYSLPSLLTAKRHARDDGIQYVVADVRRLPFQDGTFDGALCFGVLQALSKDEDAVRVLASVVSPGGHVWIDALNRWSLVNMMDTAHRKLRGRRMHLRYESATTLKRAMRAHGLERLKLYWLPILPAKLQRFQSWVETRTAKWVFRSIPLAGFLFCHAFLVRGERLAQPLDHHEARNR